MSGRVRLMNKALVTAGKVASVGKQAEGEGVQILNRLMEGARLDTVAGRTYHVCNSMCEGGSHP